MKFIFSLLFCLIGFADANSQQKTFQVNPEESAKTNYRNISKDVFFKKDVSPAAIFNDKLLAGGGFSTAGSKASIGAGLFDLSFTSGEENNAQEMDFSLFQNYPNPLTQLRISDFEFRNQDMWKLKYMI